MSYLTSLARSQYHVSALVVILLVRAQQGEVWIRSTGLCQHILRSPPPPPTQTLHPYRASRKAQCMMSVALGPDNLNLTKLTSAVHHPGGRGLGPPENF